MNKYIFIRNEKVLINCNDIAKIAIEIDGNCFDADYYVAFYLKNKNSEEMVRCNDSGEADATLKKIMDYLTKDTDYILDI